jgi:hypothetical protein
MKLAINKKNMLFSCLKRQGKKKLKEKSEKKEKMKNKKRVRKARKRGGRK